MLGQQPGLWRAWRGSMHIWVGNWWGVHEWGQERRMPWVLLVALGLESVVALTLLGGKDGRECQAYG